MLRHAQSHFKGKARRRKRTLEDVTLAHGEWVIAPFWCTERESGDPRTPETPSLEDEDGSSELPQFFLVMIRRGYQVPLMYQRFG